MALTPTLSTEKQQLDWILFSFWIVLFTLSYLIDTQQVLRTILCCCLNNLFGDQHKDVAAQRQPHIWEFVFKSSFCQQILVFPDIATQVLQVSFTEKVL